MVKIGAQLSVNNMLTYIIVLQILISIMPVFISITFAIETVVVSLERIQKVDKDIARAISHLAEGNIIAKYLFKKKDSFLSLYLV